MKQFFTLAFTLVSLLCTGQSADLSSNIDSRLLDVFDQEFLERLESDNSFLLSYYNLYLDEAWNIQEFPDGKLDSFPSVQFESSDLEEINIFKIIKKYKLERSVQAHKYYRIGNSNSVLILYSENHFAKIVNEKTGRSH